MDTNTVYEIVRFAFKQNDLASASHIVTVEWSNRMTKAMGTATIREKAALLDGGPSHLIRLSTKLFARATEAQHRQTVIHEACHLIDSIKNRRPMSHGPTWKACMRACGVRPDRYHTVDTNGLNKRHLYVCANCDKEHHVTTRLHNKMQKRISARLGITSYICGHCKEMLLIYQGLTMPKDSA